MGTTLEIDESVRIHIYTASAKGRVPPAREIADALQVDDAAVAASMRRLADSRALVLQPDGEILMAEPFSAVPTSFLVTGQTHSWWAACIWDALGIPAMLKIDAKVETSCQCCGQRITLSIEQGARMVRGHGVAHVMLPAAAWWDDIVFT